MTANGRSLLSAVVAVERENRTTVPRTTEGTGLTVLYSGGTEIYASLRILSSFFQRRSRTSHPTLTHVPSIQISVVSGSSMKNASVVPEQCVARTPLLRPSMFRSRREIVQFVDQFSTFNAAPADD